MEINMKNENKETVLSDTSEQMGMLKDAEKWSLSFDMIEKIYQDGRRENLADNMLIYKNGIIDNYDNAEDLIDCIMENHGLEDVDDIVYVVINGMNYNFELAIRVSFYGIINNAVHLENMVDHVTCTNYEVIAIFEEPRAASVGFGSMLDLAKVISVTGGEDIAYIFYKGQLYNFMLNKVLQLPQKGIEFEINEELVVV